jgi:CRISPR system Cascade subunit CasE
VPHYLSRVRINPQRAAARRLLSNPAHLRAAVLAGMPTQPVTRRVLWRLDNDAYQPLVYVVSEERPSFEHMVEQAGWPSAARPQFDVADYSSMLERLRRGERYSFRLGANPTYTVTRRAADGTTRKQRAAHKTVEHQARWLHERADDLGLRIAMSVMSGEQQEASQPDLLVAGRTRHRFARNGSGTVTIDVVTYLGHLVVADPERLRAALVSGVGRAKGYGCGLLTIAPVLSEAEATV